MSVHGPTSSSSRSFLIADDVKPSRIFELENDSHTRRTIELQQQDVTKLERFKEKIEGKGDFRFFERQEKYEMLKAFIYGKTEEAQRVHQMGWNNIGESGFYAFCNGIIYKARHAVDEYGMIRLDKENFYLPAMSKIHKQNRMAYVNERRYLHAPKQEVTGQQYFTLLHELYGDNGVVCYCYYLATLFRDIITDTTRSFPILNLYGKKGTGKTELALSLVNLFQRNPEISNLESTTYYAMGDKCSEVSNMIVHFDEYKNSLSKKLTSTSSKASMTVPVASSVPPTVSEESPPMSIAALSSPGRRYPLPTSPCSRVSFSWSRTRASTPRKRPTSTTAS